MDTNESKLAKSSWKGKTRGGVWGYRFFIFLLKTFGVKAAYVFLCFIVPYFIPFAPKATAAGWYYFRHIHKFSRWHSFRMLFVTYYRFGQVLIDKVAELKSIPTDFTYHFDDYDNFLRILHGDSGVLMIGAHVGSWEIGRRFFKDYKRKLNIVMFDAEYQKVKDMLYADGESPYNVIPVNEESFSYLLSIKYALDRKESVCFQGDRYVDGSPTIEAAFLGRQAKFPLGPFRLAEKFKVPVVFYFSIKESATSYRFHFIPVESGKSERELLDLYVASLENILHKHPEQWFNYYKFWS